MKFKKIVKCFFDLIKIAMLNWINRKLTATKNIQKVIFKTQRGIVL